MWGRVRTANPTSKYNNNKKGKQRGMNTAKARYYDSNKKRITRSRKNNEKQGQALTMTISVPVPVPVPVTALVSVPVALT